MPSHWVPVHLLACLMYRPMSNYPTPDLNLQEPFGPPPMNGKERKQVNLDDDSANLEFTTSDVMSSRDMVYILNPRTEGRASRKRLRAQEAELKRRNGGGSAIIDVTDDNVKSIIAKTMVTSLVETVSVREEFEKLLLIMTHSTKIKDHREEIQLLVDMGCRAEAEENKQVLLKLLRSPLYEQPPTVTAATVSLNTAQSVWQPLAVAGQPVHADQPSTISVATA
ncbi:unnamed protein product [Discosporangium mesarthrocarpum]